MNLADLLALAAGAFWLLVFFDMGRRAATRIEDADDYLYAGHNLPGPFLEKTLAASATSLATVVLYFVTAGAQYGALLFFSVLLYPAGNLVFLWLLRTFDLDVASFRGLSKFLYDATRSPLILVTSKMIVLSQLLSVLVVELAVGTRIFEYFSAGFPGVSYLAGFALISSIICIYVALGGFLAVAENDAWQHYLVVASVICLILFAVTGYHSSADISGVATDLSNGAAPSVGLAEIASLILFWFSINLTLPLCQMQSWHRVSAVGSMEVLAKHFHRGVFQMMAIWGGLALFGVALAGSGANVADAPQLFELMKGAGGIAALVLFPLVFAGFVAALMSTADSAAIAIILESGAYRLTISETWRGQRIKLSLEVISLFILVAAVFVLLYSGIVQNLLQVLFIMFAQSTCLFPLLLYCLAIHRSRPPKAAAELSRANLCLSAGVILGFATVWATGITGMKTGQALWTFLGGPAGIAVAGIPTLIAWRIYQRAGDHSR